MKTLERIKFINRDDDSNNINCIALMEVISENGVTAEMVARAKDAIADTKTKLEGEWTWIDCRNAAIRSLEKDGCDCHCVNTTYDIYI